MASVARWIHTKYYGQTPDQQISWVFPRLHIVAFVILIHHGRVFLKKILDILLSAQGFLKTSSNFFNKHHP